MFNVGNKRFALRAYKILNMQKSDKYKVYRLCNRKEFINKY